MFIVGDRILSTVSASLIRENELTATLSSPIQDVTGIVARLLREKKEDACDRKLLSEEVARSLSPHVL